MSVYIYGAKRTAIGKFNGQFASTAVTDLGAEVIKDSLKQSGFHPSGVEEVILGHVLQAGCGQGPARQAMIKAGLDEKISCFSVNKLCGSGLKAVMLAAQAIKAGDKNMVIAGGMENMTQAPHLLPQARKGYRLGGGDIVDHMVQDGLTDVFENYHMGITAENIAKKYDISRLEQDDFAYRSQIKAISAIDKGYFVDEITPITLKTHKGEKICNQDEHPNFDITRESLDKLRPAFQKDGSVTAGNASGINDGAAALILASSKAQSINTKPLAEIIAYADGAMSPALMGLAPTIAIKNVLDKAGLTLKDMDIVELNEAFAVQALGVLHELKAEYNMDDIWIQDHININGGAIALGHPIGASGARILVSLLYNMKRLNKKLGLASLCIGGGMAVAMIIKNI